MKKYYAGLCLGVLLSLFTTAWPTQAGTFTNLHAFVSGSLTDGSSPNDVVLVNGQLFGSAGGGGAANHGMIYTLGTNGLGFASVHDFAGAPTDGNAPNELLPVADMIYGTTFSGGTNDFGTVYKMNTNGLGVVILRSFASLPDSEYPSGGLTLGGNMLYGTTQQGGTGSYGTVFKMDTNGSSFTVLHNFTNTPDGSSPHCRLVLNGATLYGTTPSGGSNSLGTVFKINTDGNGYAVLWNFSNMPAATSPQVGLTYDNGTLYGVSLAGGTANNGVVFRIGTDGTGYTILHSFTNGEALSPQSALVVKNNLLYGLTLSGGTTFSGTIYQLATNGANFTVLKNFTNALTGTNPKGQPVLAGNSLFDVANTGGPNNGGTVFRFVLAPTISAQPQPQTVASGGNASFSVSVVDEFPVTYQWFFNTSTLLGGQTASTLNLTGVNGGSAGNYTVVVTDNGGAVTSSPALLTVTSTTPTITAQPQSLTVTNGDPATFSVTATSPGGPPLYQWYFNTNTTIVNETNSTYNIPVTYTNFAGTYTVVVTGGGISVTSSPAKLTVSTNSKPVISDQTHDQIATNGDTATFTVTASGLGVLHYQWYSNLVNNFPASLGPAFGGRTNEFLTVTAGTNRQMYYTVIVTNTLGKATSSPAFLLVITKPLITTNPQSVTVALGNPVNFSVVALGASLHYQWYSNSVNTAIGTLLTGQTASTYSFTAIASASGKYYSVVVTNTLGNTTSTPALLTVGSLPVITQQPAGATITNGSPVTFTSAASGAGPLGYQWLFQTNVLIPGATSTTLSFATANQPGSYSMKVTNSTGAATSSPALLTVIGRPIMLSSTFDKASGSFAFNFVNLAGSTNRLLTTSNLADATAWRAIATNIMATNGTWQVTDLNSAKTNAIRLYKFSSP